MKGIFKNRALLTIAASQSVSGVGNWISMVSLFALIVFYDGGGVTQSSWILLAGYSPTILCSPLAGWLSDRFDRKWLMILSEFCSGLAVLGIILSRRVEYIYGLLILQAMFGALLAPASQAAVPSLVREEELTQANALLQQLASGIKIGAPLFAGFLLTFLRPQQAMTLDVVSYALSVLILWFLPPLPSVKEAAAKEAASGESVSSGSALAALRASGMLRLLFVIGFFLVLIVGNFDLLGSVFIRDVLRQSASLFGVLVGLVGIGMVVGSGWLVLRRARSDHWRDVVIGCTFLALLPASLWVASLLATPLAGIVAVSVGCLLGGIGNSLVIVQAGTLLQLLSPPTVLGRLSGLFQSTLSAAQLIALLLTPLVVPAFITIGPFLGLGALAMLLLTGGAILSLYRKRRGSVQPEPASQSTILS